MGLGSLVSGLIGFAYENPGSPFVIVFIILLFLAVIGLALGMEDYADRLASYAYISLVIAVIIELIVVIKRRST